MRTTLYVPARRKFGASLKRADMRTRPFVSSDFSLWPSPRTPPSVETISMIVGKSVLIGDSSVTAATMRSRGVPSRWVWFDALTPPPLQEMVSALLGANTAAFAAAEKDSRTTRTALLLDTILTPLQVVTSGIESGSV